MVDIDPAVATILAFVPDICRVTLAPAFIVNAPENVITETPPEPINKFPLIVQLSSKVTVELKDGPALFIPKAFGHILPLLLSDVFPLDLVDIAPVPAGLIPIPAERVTEWFATAVEPTVMLLVIVIVPT
jgi:hypothetical protein